MTNNIVAAFNINKVVINNGTHRKGRKFFRKKPMLPQGPPFIHRDIVSKQEDPVKLAAIEDWTWADVIEKCIPSVVELRVCCVTSFENSFANCSYGTGFVVDKKQGIILTNRHIITTGPITATAVFSNKKSINVVPLYRDPVHDFGFFKYNPMDIEKDYPELDEIKLSPEEAKNGIEFRMIGSGEGEQNSIVEGTLGRLTRDAPRYSTYWDFNTFYYAAVTNSKAGSSGSPILAKSGNAVALNCGGSTQGTASYFLPVHRVKRALECLQNGMEIKRGSLLCIFKYKPFDELNLDSLSKDDVLRLKVKGAEGVLVVTELLKEGPAEKAGIEISDILMEINGVPVFSFFALEQIVDNFIDKCVTMKFASFNKARHMRSFDVAVINLQDVVPTELLQVGGAIIHPYGLTVAYSRNIELNRGLFLADPGYMFQNAGIDTDVILLDIDGKSIHSLRDVEEIIRNLEDRAEVIVSFANTSGYNAIESKVVRVDRKWFPMVKYKMNKPKAWDVSSLKQYDGKWSFSHSVHFESNEEFKRFKTIATDDGLGRILTREVEYCLCQIEVTAPIRVEGAGILRQNGVGVVVDANLGLVVASRALVFNNFLDIMLSFGSTKNVAAYVLFMHPVFNIVIIKFNPHELLVSNIKVCEAIEDVDADLSTDSKLLFHGLSVFEEIIEQRCVIVGKEFPVVQEPSSPSFCPRNEEFYLIDQTPRQCLGGVFSNLNGGCDVQNKICAFYLEYASKIKIVSARHIFRCVELAKNTLKEKLDGKWITEKGNRKMFSLASEIPVRSLGVSLKLMKIGKVRKALGLTQDLVEKMSKEKSKEKPRLLVIKNIMQQTGPAKRLEIGDVILAIEDKSVRSLEEFNLFFHSLAPDRKFVKMEILRNKQVQTLLDVELHVQYGINTKKVICVNGLVLQTTFDEVKYFVDKRLHINLKGTTVSASRGIYLCSVFLGSPGSMAGFGSLGWITAVNGKEVNTLEEFLEETVNPKRDKLTDLYTFVELSGKTNIKPIANDFHYFKPFEYVWDEGEWKYKELM